MTLVLGVTITAAAVLLYAWAFGAHRRPSPARWTRIEALSSAVVLAVTMLLPTGLGLIVAGLLHPVQSAMAMGVTGFAEIAVVAAAAVFLTPRLIAPARKRPVAEIVPMPPRDPGHETPDGPRMAA